jgi:hypothetical protein
VLTPAAAGGMVLVQRLQKAGIAFEFDRVLEGPGAGDGAKAVGGSKL